MPSSKKILKNKDIQKLPLKAKKDLVKFNPEILLQFQNPEPSLIVRVLLNNPSILDNMDYFYFISSYFNDYMMRFLLRTKFLKTRGKSRFFDQILVKKKFSSRTQKLIIKNSSLFNLDSEKTGLFSQCYKNFDISVIKMLISKKPFHVNYIENPELEMIELAISSTELSCFLDHFLTHGQKHFYSRISTTIEKLKNITNIKKIEIYKKIILAEPDAEISLIPDIYTSRKDKINYLNSKIELLKELNSQDETELK